MTVISGYLALGTLDSTGTAFTELSAVVGGYARQAVTLVSGPDGAISNISALQFANSSPNDWPSFRAYAVFDSLTGGAQILVWDVAVSHTVRPARRHSVAAGKIQLKFPRAESNHGTEVFAAPRRRKVERLLSIMDSARDNNPYQRSAMSTPPTVAVGAATDGSLAAAIPLVSANALTTTTLTKMAWYGGIPTPTSTSHVAMPVASTLPALTGNLATLVNAFGITADLSSFAYATELMTDASVIEFAIWINNARKVMFQVDGQYVDFAGSAGLGSSAVNYFKLTFASGKARRIRVLMSTLPNAVTTLTSIRTNALASIWKPSQKDVLRLAWGGDSYGEGFNTSGTIFPFQTRRGRSSLRNCWGSGIVDNFPWRRRVIWPMAARARSCGIKFRAGRRMRRLTCWCSLMASTIRPLPRLPSRPRCCTTFNCSGRPIRMSPSSCSARNPGTVARTQRL